MQSITTQIAKLVARSLWRGVDQTGSTVATQILMNAALIASQKRGEVELFIHHFEAAVGVAGPDRRVAINIKFDAVLIRVAQKSASLTP